MSRAQHDYTALRQEYITTPGLSIRELARRHEIKSWSTVNAKKKEEGWDELRERFESQVVEGEVGKLVQERLKLITDIHEELLLAVRHAVRRFIADVGVNTDGTYGPQSISARDLMGMIDKFLLLSGSTPHRSESRSIDSHSFTFDGLLDGAPDGLLRELAELAKSNGAGAGSVGRGPLVVLEGTRSA